MLGSLVSAKKRDHAQKETFHHERRRYLLNKKPSESDAKRQKKHVKVDAPSSAINNQVQCIARDSTKATEISRHAVSQSFETGKRDFLLGAIVTFSSSHRTEDSDLGGSLDEYVLEHTVCIETEDDVYYDMEGGTSPYGNRNSKASSGSSHYNKERDENLESNEENRSIDGNDWYDTGSEKSPTHSNQSDTDGNDEIDYI